MLAEYIAQQCSISEDLQRQEIYERAESDEGASSEKTDQTLAAEAPRVDIELRNESLPPKTRMLAELLGIPEKPDFDNVVPQDVTAHARLVDEDPDEPRPTPAVDQADQTDDGTPTTKGEKARGS